MKLALAYFITWCISTLLIISMLGGICVAFILTVMFLTWDIPSLEGIWTPVRVCVVVAAFLATVFLHTLEGRQSVYKWHRALQGRN